MVVSKEQKNKTYRIYNKALKDGRLVRPAKCENGCTSDRPLHGHHDDYSKPLTVRWLCGPCHGEVKAKPKPIKENVKWEEVTASGPLPGAILNKIEIDDGVIPQGFHIMFTCGEITGDVKKIVVFRSSNHPRHKDLSKPFFTIEMEDILYSKDEKDALMEENVLYSKGG